MNKQECQKLDEVSSKVLEMFIGREVFSKNGSKFEEIGLKIERLLNVKSE